MEAVKYIYDYSQKNSSDSFKNDLDVLCQKLETKITDKVFEDYIKKKETIKLLLKKIK